MPVYILSLVYKLFELTERQELGQNVVGEFTIVTLLRHCKSNCLCNLAVVTSTVGLLANVGFCLELLAVLN
jgi:hypothetical protein